MDHETTFNRGDERIVVQTDDAGSVISAQRFRNDLLIDSTTSPVIVKGWMANPN